MIIQHSVWLYARFTLSFRDVEEMLADVASTLSQCPGSPTAASAIT
jgi:transposase-like protein